MCEASAAAWAAFVHVTWVWASARCFVRCDISISAPAIRARRAVATRRRARGLSQAARTLEPPCEGSGRGVCAGGLEVKWAAAGAGFHVVSSDTRQGPTVLAPGAARLACGWTLGCWRSAEIAPGWPAQGHPLRCFSSRGRSSRAPARGAGAGSPPPPEHGRAAAAGRGIT